MLFETCYIYTDELCPHIKISEQKCSCVLILYNSECEGSHIFKVK
jgi:hypothetical protein